MHPETTPAAWASPRRLLVLVAPLLVALALVAGPTARTAHAEGTASSVVTTGNVAKDGTLKMTETITFDGAAPAEVTQKFETVQNSVGDRQYKTTISEVTATAGGAAVTPQVSTDSRYTTVTVPTNGAADLVIGYTVRGAVVTVPDGTALQWRVLQGLDVAVTSFRSTILIPGTFTYVRCTAGSPNSTTPCLSAAAGTEDASTPTFTDGPRGEGEVVGVDIGFPAGQVAANEQIDYRWTVGRAFSPDPLPLGIAVGLLVLGGLGLLLAHRRRGADAAYSGEAAPVGEFVPVGAGQAEFRVVGDVRPGHVGTVADERVDPIDVTASLVDLAVRGHLLITELPRASAFSRADWTLTRIGAGTGLRPFEQALLEGIAPDGEPVRVSEVGGRVGQSIGKVQDALYDEVVANGWYARRPDVVRNRFTQLALVLLTVAVVVTALLAAFTTFGLIGLALVVLGLGLVFVAQEMPSRTPKGVALLKGLGALRSLLLTQPTDQMPAGRAVEELSEVLPYAIVLGGTERWLDALVATDTDADPDSDDLSWYHGPADWHLRDLPESLRNFTTTVSGTLFTR
ncbi:DUF2207 family protein [Microlunatus antarcticus]|uniref:TIGR04222 domain-containing protein n=1 Tax=Microlunatus antarcticus TaxID=53388 RepID=A0A7W5P5G1_9ACTN|nr:hypothetical protein [Microlunatus antarcticus]